jgi:AraC family transcriptional regulator
MDGMARSAAGGPPVGVLDMQRRPETVVSAGLRTSGLAVELCSFPPVPPEDSVVCEREHVVSLSLTPLIDGARGRYCPDGPGQFAKFGRLHLRPAGVPLRFRMEGGAFRTVRCRVDPDAFAELTGLQGGWSDAQLSACLDIRRPGLEDAMLRLSSECQAPGRDGTALTRALGIVLMLEMARFLEDARTCADRRTGGLSPWQLRRITEHVERHGGASSSLETLAALCGLGTRQLTRAFKHSTGQTVADFVDSTRMGKAKTLLATSGLAIAEIASRLGFPSASAFSTAFRRATGLAPRSFRRCAR